MAKKRVSLWKIISISRIRHQLRHLPQHERVALRIWKWKTGWWLALSIAALAAYGALMEFTPLAYQIALLFFDVETQQNNILTQREAGMFVLKLIGTIVGLYWAAYIAITCAVIYYALNRDYPPRSHTDIGFQVRCRGRQGIAISQFSWYRALCLFAFFNKRFVCPLLVILVFWNLLLLFIAVMATSIIANLFGPDAMPSLRSLVIGCIVLNLAAAAILDLLISVPILTLLALKGSKHVKVVTAITRPPPGTTPYRKLRMRTP